jgi:hypothetical protein
VKSRPESQDGEKRNVGAVEVAFNPQSEMEEEAANGKHVGNEEKRSQSATPSNWHYKPNAGSVGMGDLLNFGGRNPFSSCRDLGGR